MEKKRTKLDCCFENDEIYEIGEQWTDHNYCNLKTCEPGGRISVTLCPPLDLSSSCSKIEGDLNQEFPQCCPVMECSRDEPSSESSSSSSSSDVDEEDLFDDDGDLDVFNFDDPSNQPVDSSGEDSSSHTRIHLETENSKDLSNSQIQMKNFDDNKPNKYIIRFTPNTNTSRENISLNNKDSATSLRSNDAVLKDITNRGETTIYEPSSQLDRHTETQVHGDLSEDKYNKETKVTTEALSQEKDSPDTTKDKVLDTQWIGVSKALDSITENKTLIGSINTSRENVSIELTDPENDDLAHPSQNDCEDSMDNINFSARDLDEKTSLHTTDADAEHLETPQYKITDYLDDVQDDPRFKELNNVEKTSDEVLREKNELPSISLETRQNVSDFENIADKTPFGDDKTYFEDSPFLGKHSPENTEKEEIDGHNLTTTEEVLYKTETTDGVIYNPVDSEGFLINPKDNLAIESVSNTTITEGTTNHTQNHFKESGHPGLQDKISYDLEVLNNNTDENYDEESNRIIGSEEMLNTDENIDTLQNNDNSEEYANTQLVDVLDTETKFLTDVNVEEYQLPPQGYESIDSTVLNDDNADNEEIVVNNENMGILDGAVNDQILEDNQTTDFTGSHHAAVEDNESVKSFDMKVENNLLENDEDFENIDGADHEIIALEEQEDLPGYTDAGNQVQDFEEPIQSAQTFQNADEEEEDDYNPAQDFENNSFELAEEETNYTTTEQSSHVEGSSESTTEVTEIFDTGEDDDEIN